MSTAPRQSFYPQNPSNPAPRASTGTVASPAAASAAASTTTTSSSSSSSSSATFVVGTQLPPSTESNVASNEHEGIVYRSESMPEGSTICRGYDFNKGIDYDELFNSFLHTGFQATHLAEAIAEIRKMIRWRLSDENDDPDYSGPPRHTIKCTIFLGYTSNMISCGVREIIRFLVQHKMITCIVTSAGGIEEDLMKCMCHHYMGDFHLNGRELRQRGLNRIGNLIVPNLNYCDFEQFMTPILDEMMKEQVENNKIWSPSSMIAKFGERIANEDSVLYWAWKNNIPIFCPGITDGSIGDMIYFHACMHRDSPLIVDIAQDIRKLNEIALMAEKSGQLIIGGGIIKHHICNANLMRNGADYSVYINTGLEHDGSDAGAAPDEAVSWGKIKLSCKPVKVWGEASILFPIIVAQTFAKEHWMQQENNKQQQK